MFLTTPEFPKLPKWTLAMGQYTTIPKPGKWGWEKPDDLEPLEKAQWPEEVKESIAKLFKSAGIKEPFQQKLVEPTAHHYGGWKRKDGTVNFEAVNWIEVLDYFTWEIASSKGDRELSEQLQDEGLAKYGHGWNHKQPYSSDGYY